MGGAVLIVLDTHAWIWWTSGSKRLPRRALNAIGREKSIGVCAITCWEVGMLVANGRLGFDRDVLLWIREALAQPRVELIPLTPEIAVTSTTFGKGYPEDPADRLIVASALHHRAPLVTADTRIRACRAVTCIW